MNKIYHAAVYLRLSREDGDVVSGGKSESNSISNQKELVMDYLKSRPELQPYDTYTDDGYSGVNFDRPEFQRMLNDIREGHVDCVVVKDLSHFGRNYIESGRYIEKIFPMLGIRFIAITDSYDSLNEDYGNDMIVPFKNLINDAYCRDISTKIRSHMRVKRRNGEYIAPFAAYGYRKDPEDRNHLVIDPYAADVVRDIYSMKLCGTSIQAIAERLNQDGILAPIQYKKSIGIRIERPGQSEKPKWSYQAVRRILTNEVYIGTTVQGKVTTPNYKVKKCIRLDESKWVKVENTHEPIVTNDEFQLVQALLQRDTRVSPEHAKLYPLSGMVFCADCGEPMVRKTVPSGKKRFVYYICAGNKRNKSLCSPHRIPAKKLEESVLKAVNLQIEKILTLSEAAEILRNAPALKPDVIKQEKRVKKLEEEAELCTRRRKNLYEDYKDGILSKEEYFLLRDQYEKEQEEISDSIGRVKSEAEQLIRGYELRQDWVESLKKYRGLQTLDRKALSFLVDRIEVESSGRIAICYRYGKEIDALETYISSEKEAV